MTFWLTSFTAPRTSYVVPGVSPVRLMDCVVVALPDVQVMLSMFEIHVALPRTRYSAVPHEGEAVV